MANSPPSLADTRQFLSLLAKPGDVFELRGLGKNAEGRPHVTAGYFDDLDELVKAAGERSGKDIGVYVTLNPVLPALLARAPKNRVRRAGNGDTTSDRDVLVRRSILVDVDPIRPQGISSTDEEHVTAIALARRIADDLTASGWPIPIIADSGNGGHLIYAVDLPVDDGGLVKRVLDQLSKLYTTPALKIDEKVFNPGRISKLYGTMTRKGEDVPERPHRLARILSAPTMLDIVSREQLERLAPAAARTAKGTAPQHVKGNGRSERREFDIDAFIASHLPDAIAMPWSEGRKWLLPVCPFNDSHDRREAFICEKHVGQLSAGCLHESCKWQWHELREHFEPDAYAHRNGNGDHRLTDREPPHEVLYEDAAYQAELETFAARDAEPRAASNESNKPEAPTKIRWKRLPELADVVWARKDDPWISLALGDDEIVRVRAGGIAVIMGGSGSGKSSLVANMLIRHARDHGPAIALSIELPADELAARIVGIKCDASWEDALRGRVPLEHVREALALPRMAVIDRRDATIANLRACAEAMRAEYPGQPILAAIDYAQLLHSNEREMRMRVADAFDQIDDVAREQRLVAIAVSQMGREGARAAREGERLGIETADLGAETAAIERFATITLTIGKSGEPREDGSKSVELSMGKSRMGNVGDSVRELTSWGKSGLWRCAGEAQPAAKVRENREVEKTQKREKSTEMQIIGLASTSKTPVTRNQLIEGSTGRRVEILRAISKLIASGDLVEVARHAPRSRSWLLWTTDRAVDAGAPLVRDTLLGANE